MTATYSPGQIGELTPEPTITYDIGVDIDDVLHPWYDTAHKLSVAAGITNGVTPRTWRMADEYGCHVEVWAEVLEKATQEGLLYGVPPIPGSVEAVRRLAWMGHRIHLITARGTASWQSAAQRKSIHEQTQAWLHEYAVPHDSLHFTSEKVYTANQLGLDYFVDDGVHNFEALAMGTEGCEVYLMSAGHNRDYWTPFRVETVDEFADIVINAGRKGSEAPRGPVHFQGDKGMPL